MKAKVLKPFKDKKEGVTRNLGDTLTLSKERFDEINSTNFGILVAEVTEETKQPKTRKSMKKVGD